MVHLLLETGASVKVKNSHKFTPVTTSTNDSVTIPSSTKLDVEDDEGKSVFESVFEKPCKDLCYL
ncbi:Myosin-like protein [Phytophthora palmivora]|uniref:Myosin-like protein n=1 Tax=Phytophthora palmivora TaxID=4796 RepID=A0A2P4XF49_9STRA|nr:Myosin-like protein [Phytophthora palmivora]